MPGFLCLQEITNPMPPSVILYGTSACHLCEDAEALLLALRDAGLAFELQKIDIADDDALVERYGIRIPVLRLAGGEAELGWPFDLQQAADFIGGAA